MPDIDFNFYATLFSICSLIVSIFACYQTSKTIKLANRAHVCLYLVSTKKHLYVKVRNYGNSSGKILYFETDVDIEETKRNDKYPFPLVGLRNISIAPGTSKVAMIMNKYANSGHWLSVTYLDELTNKEYSHTIELNTYSEYALIDGEDFNLVDY